MNELIYNSPKMQEISKKQKQIIQREIAIIRLICQEYTSHEIAEKLGISKSLVDAIRLDLCARTKSRNTIGLVKYAIKHKIFILK
jgi:DNA-binding CsgD family transcriptional regulator